MLSQGGYVIAPGSEVFMKLTAKEISRLGKPHGTCKDVESQFSKFGGKTESVRECQQVGF